ncbi:mannose-1-phosphate guanyltransferase alpha-A isoform X2 [Condylostylus longicornis]|uniref:mannose-1-phosphate guanyltransferase alpha-A isoform X2 n=1 Tax=Condylostylus longicornis TaxID=2530218 RepID=UPI00244DA05B|nr:mannose-1-phosphate guanyltransferase alpha-A isoform X2 [Condylostylus longicornis]
MLKAVILVGGPQKGTRFRPLSLDSPKPLFPVAGRPIIQHHIEACMQVKDLKEILIIGFYPINQMEQFINEMQNLHNINIRYLQEFTPLGTAGGMYHFRDQIRTGNPKAFFVLNGDVCADFPLQSLYDFHTTRSNAMISIMSTEATRQQSVNYGCLVFARDTGLVSHYVEKPSSYISSFINCGVYVCSLDVFSTIATIFNSREYDFFSNEVNNGCNGKDQGHILWEQEILTPLAGTGKLFTLPVTTWWSQLKTAGAAIYANRHYLAFISERNSQLYRKTHPERLSKTGIKTELSDESLVCNVIQDVHIHPTASVHPTATLGPNVSIGAGVTIGPGVRIKETIVLDNAVIQDHTLVLHSIVGRGSIIGCWARVEGTPSDPDPNKPFAKMENPPLFNKEGKLNPSITVLGGFVNVPSEKILLNSIVLPHKELSRNFKNEIIL